MNVRFKFRAWHNGIAATKGTQRKQYGEWIEPPQMLYDGKPGDCLVWKSQGQDIAQVMQWTGLQDKNGVNIYEGDIIKQRRSNKPYSKNPKWEDVVLVVKWYDGLAHRTDNSLELNPQAINNKAWFNEQPKFIATPAEKTKLTSYAWSAFHGCEVIGNIYENPSLIGRTGNETTEILNEVEAEEGHE